MIRESKTAEGGEGGVLIWEPMRGTDIVKVSGWGRRKKGNLKVADESRGK